jgi:hypothetical protein
MTWKIQIPHRSREDSLTDVADACRELPADEAAVARELVLGCIVDGSAKSAGDLIDLLEKASPDTRRRLLDQAREKAGLKSASRIDFEQSHALVQQSAVSRSAYAPPPRLAYSESGAIVDLAEQELEAERARAQEQRLRRVREEREAERAVEAEEFRRNEQARSEALRREVGPLPGAGA